MYNMLVYSFYVLGLSVLVLDNYMREIIINEFILIIV